MNWFKRFFGLNDTIDNEWVSFDYGWPLISRYFNDPDNYRCNCNHTLLSSQNAKISFSPQFKDIIIFTCLHCGMITMFSLKTILAIIKQKKAV